MANIGLKTYERNLVWECKCTAIPSLSLSFRRSHAPSIFCSLSITPLYLYTHSFSLYMQGEPWNLLLLCMICVLWTSTMAKRQIHTITYKRMCEEESSKIKNFENKKQRTFMTAKSADKFRLSVFFWEVDYSNDDFCLPTLQLSVKMFEWVSVWVARVTLN